jgi:hypothetical protein
LEPQALQEMVDYAGGLPVLAHEIGDAVWRAAEASVVTEHDARIGIAHAAVVAGHKFLEPQVEQALRNKRYRAILRKLVQQPFHFQRNDLKQELTPEEEKVLGNFLNRMRKLGAIVPDYEAGAGSYRFAKRLYQLYFSLDAARAEKAPK